jgi:large subunit ribosomal protein L31
VKKDIHPEYRDAVFSCACGNFIHTRSTAGDVKFDICSNCHPFYTGRQKLVDSAGRVDKYIRRYGGSQAEGTDKKKDEKKDS